VTISNRSTTALLWTAAAAVALALAGCDRPAPSPQVATARSAAPAAAPSSSATPKLSDYDKALNYTRCMTAAGAPTPDPVVGKPLVTVNTVRLGESEASIEAKQAGFAKCRRYLPATWPLKEDPADTARESAFVACVRKHGLSWPKPGADGMAAWPTDPQAMNTQAYKDAIQDCRHLYDDPANNLPENK